MRDQPLQIDIARLGKADSVRPRMMVSVDEFDVNLENSMLVVVTELDALILEVILQPWKHA